MTPTSAARLARAPLGALAAALLLPTLLVAQQSDDEWLRRCEEHGNRGRLVRYCAVQVERIPAAGTPIRVDAGRNGPVQVRGWDRAEIEIHARIQARADTRAAARAIAEQVRIAHTGTDIRADGPPTSDDETWSAGFVVYVPERSDLRLETRNGPIGVRGVHGEIQLQARNGPVSLDQVGGAVHARTANGPISVSLTGSRWDGAGLDAETRNGPISLRIPDGYSARLETGTVNGPMQTDVPLQVTLRGRHLKRIETVLGDGGPPVRVVTTNGPVTIRRR